MSEFTDIDVNALIKKNNINEKNENIQNQLNLNKYMTGIQAQANNVTLNLELKETKKQWKQ